MMRHCRPWQLPRIHSRRSSQCIKVALHRRCCVCQSQGSCMPSAMQASAWVQQVVWQVAYSMQPDRCVCCCQPSDKRVQGRLRMQDSWPMRSCKPRQIHRAQQTPLIALWKTVCSLYLLMGCVQSLDRLAPELLLVALMGGDSPQCAGPAEHSQELDDEELLALADAQQPEATHVTDQGLQSSSRADDLGGSLRYHGSRHHLLQIVTSSIDVVGAGPMAPPEVARTEAHSEQDKHEDEHKTSQQ